MPAKSARTVAGYGAPSKAPVLVSLAGVDDDLLPYTVDLSPAKQGCRLPGTRIPILSPDELLARRPDEVVVLTWDIADEIVDQLSRSAEGTGWRPKLFVPLSGATETFGLAIRSEGVWGEQHFVPVKPSAYLTRHSIPRKRMRLRNVSLCHHSRPACEGKHFSSRATLRAAISSLIVT